MSGVRPSDRTVDFSRKRYLERQRTSQACKKCRSLKRKCSGERPKCQNCQGYGFECRYSDLYRGKRIRTGSDDEFSPLPPVDSAKTTSGLGRVPHGLEQYLERIAQLHKLEDDDRAQALYYARKIIGDGSSAPLETSRQTQFDLDSRDTSEASTSVANGLQLPPIRIRPSGILDRSSDIAFVKFVKNQSEDTGASVQNITYFLDEQEIVKPQFQSLEDLFRYPSQQESDRLLDAYFATLHIAYPFLCERRIRRIMSRVYDGTQLWSDLDRQTLSMMNFLFALGSYWCNWPYDDHCMYFARGRQLFFDIFKNSTVQVVQCQLLACFYLLIINKPARSWNVLGLVVRSCQNLGLVTDTENSSISAVEMEMNRRLWYSAYVLEHLIALQLGRQPNMRDEDFMVSLPMEVSDWRFRDDGSIDERPHESDAAMPYFNALIGFSRIIGIAQRELFFLNKPSMTWENTIRVIAEIDEQLRNWKKSLNKDLDFENPSSLGIMTSLRRQRNFFAMKYHNLRSIIHRPHITLAIMRHSKLGNDARANRREQDICLNEARQTIRLLDHVDSARTLQWDFPLWQLIPCLMSAATILVVGHKLITNNIERAADISRDIEICLEILDSLEKNNAAQKCAALIRSLMQLHLKDIAPPVTRAPSMDESMASSYEQPYDQTCALDLDYLTSLDLLIPPSTLDPSGVVGQGHSSFDNNYPNQLGSQLGTLGMNTQGPSSGIFDWGENDFFGSGQLK